MDHVDTVVRTWLVQRPVCRRRPRRIVRGGPTAARSRGIGRDLAVALVGRRTLFDAGRVSMPDLRPLQTPVGVA